MIPGSVLVLALAIPALWILYRQLRKKTLGYTSASPPGPPPKLFVGNTFDIPLRYRSEEFIRWGKKYNSDILYANTILGDILILNKEEDAIELLDKRSRIYSSRPALPVIPLIGQQGNTGLLPYGEDLKLHRKLFQQHLRSSALPSLHPMIVDGVNQALQGLLNDPDSFFDHFKLFGITLPLRLMYGYHPTSFRDPIVTVGEETARLISDSFISAANIVNVFPAVRHIPTWLPGGGINKSFQHIRYMVDQAQRLPWQYAKSSFTDGNLPHCVMKHVLQEYEEDKDEIKLQAARDAAYTTYGAAADTVPVTIDCFIHAMATHPDIQKKAKGLINDVIGHHAARLPSLDDRKQLPYIDAIIRETLRWRQVAPLGVPHTTTEDDVYKGYFIPKGTTVLPNVMAMAHDERVYPEPESFKPERFLTTNGELTNDEVEYPFGFGRRTCPGRLFALDMLWLTTASIIATFDILPKKDASGNDIPMPAGMDDNGLVHGKTPFVCSISVQSEKARELILSSVVTGTQN